LFINYTYEKLQEAFDDLNDHAIRIVRELNDEYDFAQYPLEFIAQQIHDKINSGEWCKNV